MRTDTRADDARRSLAVLKRAGMKLTGYALIAWGQWLAGRGFAAPLASMALATALVSAIVGFGRRVGFNPAHYTWLDEAAWFLLLAFVLGRLP